MKTSIIALLTFGLFNQALACATLGDTCGTSGETACVCDSGYLAECVLDDVPTDVQYVWISKENCPVPSDGGLQCVDGACTS